MEQLSLSSGFHHPLKKILFLQKLPFHLKKPVKRIRIRTAESRGKVTMKEIIIQSLLVHKILEPPTKKTCSSHSNIYVCVGITNGIIPLLFTKSLI
jgi:hypothetical protein